MALQKNLKKIYYDPSHSASFAGKRRLLQATYGKLPSDTVSDWLDSESTYNKHKQIRKKFQHRPYTVFNVDDLWECDLIDLRFLKNYNDDFTYILCVIDVFSKYVWIEMLKNKSGESIIKAFRSILKKSNPRQPIVLQSDKGKEFVNSNFQSFLKQKNIRFRVVRNPVVKAAVVERFNRTLKNRMWRYFTFSRSKRYVDILQQLVQSYNKSYHRTIKTTPASVTLENANEIRNILHKKLENIPEKKRKYCVNDLVRISSAKTAFSKGYESGWSEEIFKIIRVLDQRQPTVYIIADLNNEEIEGIFYTEELNKIGKLPKNGLKFNKILNTRGRGRNKESLVNWKNLPEDYVTWIPSDKLK